jgi:hypothetical protein
MAPLFRWFALKIYGLPAGFSSVLGGDRSNSRLSTPYVKRIVAVFRFLLWLSFSPM